MAGGWARRQEASYIFRRYVLLKDGREYYICNQLPLTKYLGL